MLMRGWQVWFAAALLASAGALAIAYRPRTPPANERVTLAAAAVPSGAVVVLAQEAGLFGDEGLDIDLIYTPSGKDALAELMAGRVQYAAAADTPIAIAIMRDAQLRVLCTLGASVDQVAVVARVDRGISVPGDLAGKRVGLLSGSNAEYMLDTLLDYHGVPQSEVRRVDMSPDRLPRALREGSIDAVSVWSPIYEMITRESPDELKTFTGAGIYRWTWNLVGSAVRRPEVEHRMLRALAAAAARIERDPRGAAALLSDRMGVPPAQLIGAWSQTALHPRLDQSMLLSLESQARWAVTKGYTQRLDVPNLLRSIDPLPLAGVAPERITLVHPAVTVGP